MMSVVNLSENCMQMSEAKRKKKVNKFSFSFKHGAAKRGIYVSHH